MSSPRRFDMQEALRQAQAHLDAGNVTAQRGSKTPCYVHDDGSRCIIGAMLPEDVTLKLYAQANDRTVQYVRHMGWLEFSGRDFMNLQVLQMVHDHVCEGKLSFERFMIVFDQVKRSYSKTSADAA